MQRKHIDSCDRVLRYCVPQSVQGNEITSLAFKEKPDRDGNVVRPSVNWVECDRGRSLISAYRELEKKLKFAVGSAVVVLRVSDIRNVFNRDGCAIDVENEPVEGWCCHSELEGVVRQDRKVCSRLVDIAEVFEPQ